jgi:hypothetical protein
VKKNDLKATMGLKKNDPHQQEGLMRYKGDKPPENESSTTYSTYRVAV